MRDKGSWQGYPREFIRDRVAKKSQCGARSKSHPACGCLLFLDDYWVESAVGVQEKNANPEADVPAPDFGVHNSRKTVWHRELHQSRPPGRSSRERFTVLFAISTFRKQTIDLQTRYRDTDIFITDYFKSICVNPIAQSNRPDCPIFGHYPDRFCLFSSRPKRRAFK